MDSSCHIVHTPVLLQECLHCLSPEGEAYSENAFLIDSTLGEGGHSNAFLKTYPNLHVLGLDADANIQAKARQRLACYGDRMDFHLGWFDDFYRDFDFSPENPRPNLILFDLGISVYHYEESGRGFSFRKDEALDMRLNPNAGPSAADVVNDWSEQKLADTIYLYGEERYSRRIAAAIVTARGASRIESSADLAEIIYNAVPAAYRHGHLHPATRTFQALRIAVNGELNRLPRVLPDAFDVLQVGGKMGVISFHSLEDRIVKNYFRNLGKACVCPPEQPICKCGGSPHGQVLTRKPVLPSREEVETNGPSRSAKLRVIRKLKEIDREISRMISPFKE
ncbi:MAG: 16S rRNA (cytosine(1402)-N(4))-methyltransferase RsmH [Spirochaetaceae bacterium]|nr:16S rRNA (cytosine(1402)-N(4))-methyltransferase RsmH [Spirochaetaceae bacterium]